MLEAVNKNFSTIKTRSVIEPDNMYTKFPKLACVPQALKMDFSRILNKPYYIATIPWTTTNLEGAELFTTSGAPFVSGFNVPDSIFLNALSKIPFQASTLYRGKVRLIIQVAGTPMHQGCVLFSAQPVGFQVGVNTLSNRINSLMAAPHVFAFANESTAVSLEVPFYFNTKLGKTDLDNSTIQPNYSFGNYAQILATVLNPLQGPAGSSTSLSFSVHAEFLDMEFYGPHVDVTYAPAPSLLAQGILEDFKKIGTGVIDSAFSTAGSITKDVLDRTRGMVRSYTGLDAHNFPNIFTKQHIVARQMANITDMPKQYEKMDPYGEYDRICNDYIFDTERDEMLMREIITKPQLIGHFTIKSTDTTGTLCWARGISPFSQATKYSYTNTEGEVITTSGWDNLFQTMYAMTRFWRGTIKIHIQSVMSNFHYCKLLVAKDYSIRKNGLTQYPAFSSVPNLLTDTLEFSAGGQVQTIELPFLSPLEVMPNTFDWNLIASQLGMYYVYLAQPLVVNGAVVSSVDFNVYISAGDDFSFYGYAVNPLRLILPYVASDPPSALSGVRDLEKEEFKESLVAQGDSISDDAKVPEPVGKQKQVTFSEAPQDIPYDTSIMRPVVSVRDIARRSYLVFKERFTNDALTANRGVVSFDVAELLGLRSEAGLVTGGVRSASASTLEILQHLYHGYSGGARIKVAITGTSNATAWYVPPGYMVQSKNQAGTTGEQLWMSTQAIPNSNQQDLALDQLFSPVLLGSADEVFSMQTVTQELPNLAINSFASNVLYAGSESDQSASYCELELEIPNMSPYRFVGDYVSKVAPGLVVMSNTPTTNMGYFAIFVPQQVNTDGNVSRSGISLSVYVAVDDVARMGYQVHSPAVMLPAAVVGGGAPQPNFSFVGGDYAPPGTAQISASPINSILFYAKA